MQRFRFPIAVALTSLGLVLVFVVASGVVVANALASSPLGAAIGQGGAPWMRAGDHGGWQSANLPPELTGLADVAPSQRFAHFRGVQVQLTDKNNQPVSVNVTPGTATAVSDTSLTLAANDGSTQTFALDAKTITHAGKPDSTGTDAQSNIKTNQNVVVVTLNGSRTAAAVVAFDPNGMGPRGPWGHQAEQR